MKKGFTLVELLVVIGMLAILVGAIGSGINQARKRAMIAKATQDVKEMTNALAALANYTSDGTLSSFSSDGWQFTAESDSTFSKVLGGTIDGRQVPVLYNAHIRANGDIVDPWGRRYQYTIRKSNTINNSNPGVTFLTAASLPNFYRLTDKERQ